MKNLTPLQRSEIYIDNLVLLGYRGSIAHNMYVPRTEPNGIDDIDLMGVFLAPVDHYIGIKQVKETKEKYVDEYDLVHYEYIKYIRLLLKSNPNVLSLLWLKPNLYLYKNECGTELLNNRECFVSKKIYKSFTGYAYAQVKKMEKCNYRGYMGKKRKMIVDKLGYDAKSASHCIRLLKMGIEFLSTGELNVFRHDAAMLLKIKNGEWSLEKVKAEADRLFELADKALVKSVLPAEPMYDEVNEMVKRTLKVYIGE